MRMKERERQVLDLVGVFGDGEGGGGKEIVGMEGEGLEMASATRENGSQKVVLRSDRCLE